VAARLSAVTRGDVRLCRFGKPDKRRPVVVLSREDALRLLRTVIVAPITTTMHGIDSEVPVGIDEGLKRPSAANLDHVQCVSRDRLVRWLGRLAEPRLREICRALAVATGCGD
jgi:mRNA interferase MazF